MNPWKLMCLSLSIALIGMGLLLIAVSSAHGASRPVQTLTVVNAAGVPARALSAAEAAVTVQVNTQLDAYWTGRPRIAFVPAGGWLVTLVRGRAMRRGGICGYHAAGSAPYAVVGLSCGQWSVTLSHEVMEMVVDPQPGSYRINGQVPEVSDPVTSNAYELRGVDVSDFVTPSYFWRAPDAVLDQLRLLFPF